MAHFASRASERLTRFLSFGRKAHQSPGCPSANPGSSAIASPRNDLPIELLLPIFQQLSLADTLSCRLACRWFQRVIDDTPEMRYHIELYVAARKDNNLNNMMGTGARFEALVSHEKSWKPPHGSWSRTSFEWEHGNKLYHQYYDNVWVRSLREGDLDRTKWSHWNAVQCVCFERAEDGSAIVDTWRLSFPFVFESFVVEPSRGILYLCNSRPIHEKTGYRLWRVSILDGSILSDTLFETDGWRIDERWLSQSMSCQGDVIAVMTLFTSVKMENHMVGTRMALLDCRSEDVVALMTRTNGADVHIAFQFISKTCILFHCMEEGCFTTDVYTVVPDSTPNLKKIKFVASLGYPELQYSHTLAVGGSTFNIARTWGGLLSKNAPPRPFASAEDAQIISILREYGNVGLTRILHCIPISVFLTAESAYGPPHHAYVPWKSWGPRNTRCFVDYGSCRPDARGHRVMLPDFTLLDFNPLDIARDLQFAGKAPNRQPKQNEKQTMNSLRQFPTKKPSRLHPDEEADDVELPSGRIVRQPTIIRRGALFYEDIITTLPYREYKHIGDWRGSEPLFISGGEVWVACTVTVEMNENVTNYWILNVKGGS